MLINFLVTLALALFLLMSFFYKMWQLRQEEADIWKSKFQKLEIDNDKAIKDLRESETKYRSAISALEREQVKTRVNNAVNEQINSLANISTPPKTAIKVNTLKVERDVKPSSTPKGIQVSKSTMNALMASNSKEVLCPTS